MITVSTITTLVTGRIPFIFSVAFETHTVLPAAAFRVVLASAGVDFANVAIF